MVSDYFNERKREELEFVRQNPRTSIEAVVRHIAKKDLASRITVRNDLAGLAEDGYIIIRKDNPRSQVCRLLINEENKLMKVMKEMDLFKERYFALLKNMKVKYPKINARILDLLRSRKEPIALNRYDYMRLAWPLYDHFIGVYLMKAIFIWQKDIKDIETINKLYALLFETIYEINLKLSELCFDMTNSQHKSSVHDYLLNQTFKLTPVNLENLLNICNSHELNKEFEPLVDTLWNIGLDLVNKRFEVYKNDEDFSELSMIQNPEDWKKIVQVVRDSRMRRRRRIKEA